ncbi:MAG: desulfoferrodoxin Dfx [Lachnospiraceae bacterium]|nr:desulfoferrodoxin Dfx [Lachnospiraceae bacterium]
MEDNLMKIFKCNLCGKIMYQLNDVKTPTICCGEEMVELKANTTDAATEKHVPFVTEGEKAGHIMVQVGEVEHPMTEEHSIQWIACEQDNRVTFNYLKPGEKPVAKFKVKEGVPYTIYEYCNLHGLWKVEK